MPDCLEKQHAVIEKDESDVVFGRSKWFTTNPLNGEIVKGKIWHEGIARGLLYWKILLWEKHASLIMMVYGEEVF